MLSFVAEALFFCILCGSHYIIKNENTLYAVKTSFFAFYHSKGQSSLAQGTGRVNDCGCRPAPLAPTTGNCDCLWYDSSADQPVTTTDHFNSPRLYHARVQSILVRAVSVCRSTKKNEQGE